MIQKFDIFFLLDHLIHGILSRKSMIPSITFLTLRKIIPLLFNSYGGKSILTPRNQKMTQYALLKIIE